MTSKSEIAMRLDDLPADLSSIPTDGLRRALTDAIGVTARTLGQLALIWQELEARGEDMSALRGGGLFFYLPLIASGRLAPEAVVRCAGQATLLKNLSTLPLREQEDILLRGLPVAEAVEDRIETHYLAVEEVTIMHIRQAFIGDRLRTVQEQARLLTPTERRAGPETRGVIVKVKLTRDEYAALRKAAAAERQQAPTYARNILLAALEG